MEPRSAFIRETCTLIRVRAPRCAYCGAPLHHVDGYVVRVGPIAVLLESSPRRCPSCRKPNHVALVLRDHRSAAEERERVERDGALPEELGDVFEALPNLHPERVAPRGEKRNPRRAR